MTHSTNIAEPRFATPRRDYRHSNIDRLVEIGRQIKQLPLAWQVQVLAVAGEIFTPEECKEHGVPIGTPAYREIWVTVPRQSGKTILALILMLDRCIFWDPFNNTPMHIRYTSTTGKVARKKLLQDMGHLMTSSPPVNKRIDQIKKGVGHEEIRFKNGALIHPGNNTEDDAHGETLDFGVIDEAWKDDDFSREGGMKPAMNTRHQAQLLGISTAGNNSSVLLKRKVDRGRKAIAEDKGYGIAYFEWSAKDTDDPYNEDTWWKVHPTLGTPLLSLATLRHEAEETDPVEFKRAYLNIPSERLNSNHISPEAFATVCGPYEAKGDGDKVIAVDVSHDRTNSAIAICNTTTGVAELVHHDPGTAWVAARANHLSEVLGKAPIVYDTAGPVANIGKDHKKWHGLTGPDYVSVCADFYDAVIAEDIRIRACDELDDKTGEPHQAASAKRTLETALANAEVRRTGDRWSWARSPSAGDISPLIAITEASAWRPKTRKLKPVRILGR